MLDFKSSYPALSAVCGHVLDKTLNTCNSASVHNM